MSTMDSALTPLLWFAAVLALIPFVLWLVRRSPVGASLAAGPMRTVSQLPLSGTQRLVTVEVGSGEDRVWLVLGVTPHGIRTLHTMAPQAGAAAAAATPQTAFAQLLSRMRDGGGASDGR
jgi:flagellar protein FliO/FliZ